MKQNIIADMSNIVGFEVRAWEWFCRKKWIINQGKKKLELATEIFFFFCLGCCSSDSMWYILMLFSLDCYTT